MSSPIIEVKNLHMRYDDFVVMNDLNFQINKSDVFVIMGGSGCGKSTLLKHLVGLKDVEEGDVLYKGKSLVSSPVSEVVQLRQQFGVMFQSGALWSSMTLKENLSLPLEQYTQLNEKEIADRVRYKLALVGLQGFENSYPSEISGGMKKRAGFARAMILDPEVVFFDEPSAGLDPLSSRRLDDLILQISDSLQTTVVIVTHELDSIFSIGKTSIFLDVKTKTLLDKGPPKQLRDHSEHEAVRKFLQAGQ